LVLFLILISGLLSSSSVQTYLVTKGLESYFAEDSVNLSLNRIHLLPFSELELDNLLLTDQKGDTFIYVDFLNVLVQDFDLEKLSFELKRVELTNSKFHLVHYQDEQYVNIRFLLDHFASDDTSTSPDFFIGCNEIRVTNFDFVWHNQNINSGIKGMDFDNIHVSDMDVALSDFRMENLDINSQVDHLSFSEQSGFVVDTLITGFSMNMDSMAFENLKIITPNSSIYGRYSMNHGSFDYYPDYIEKVIMRGFVHDVSVDMKDIIYFSDNLIGFNEVVSGNGAFEGTVSDFVASDLDFSFRRHSTIRGKVVMEGIPNIDSTYMEIELVNSVIHPHDVDELKLEAFSENLNIQLPSFIENYEEAVLNGRLEGYYYNFRSDIQLQGRNGELEAHFSLEKKADDEYYYSGKCKSNQLNLRQLSKSDLLGKLTTELSFKGKGTSKATVELDVSGSIARIDLNGYSYSNSVIDGKFLNEIFTGQIQMKDPNCKFTFLGEIDLTQEEPRFVFVSEVDTLFPRRLNLITRDSSSFITAKFNVDSKGDDLEHFIGKIQVEDLKYFEKGNWINIPDFKLHAFQINERRQLEFKSTIGKGILAGSYHIPKFDDYFKSMISRSVPALVENKEYDTIPGNFSFDMEMYNLNPILKVFYPSISVDSNLFVSGVFDGPHNKINLDVSTEGFQIANLVVDTMNFKLNHDDSSITSSMDIKALVLDKEITYHDVHLEGFGMNDSISVKIRNDNRTVPEFKSYISFNGALLGPNDFRFSFDSSYVVLADSVWELNTQNVIEIEPDRWSFKGFDLVGNDKRINLAGAISKDTSEALDIGIGGLNLGNFAKIAGVKEAQLRGNVTGNVRLSKLYSRPEISSSLYVKDLYANDQYIGSGPIYSSWNAKQKRFDVNFDLFRPADSTFIDTIRSLKFYGHYYPTGGDTAFHLKLKTDGFKIKAIEPIISDYIDNIEGELVGEVDLSGSFSEPVLNGEMRLDSTQFRIVYLNTNYFAHNQSILFRDEWFGFNSLTLFDENNRPANAFGGTVLHNNWKDFNYDVLIDVDTFLCLNTNVKQNDLYYGTAFLNGEISVSGYEDHMELEIDAKALNNSKLFVPLYSAEEVYQNEYIRFVNLEVKEEEAESKTDLTGIDMKFNFDIDPSTEIELIFDDATGEKIYAQGGGKLKMNIDEQGDFTINGLYEIRNGNYYFNFENIISKKFILQQGGTIEFDGDPFNARIDVVAQYKVKASLQPILNGDSAYSQKVDNICLMHFTDQLSSPNIGFDIKVLNVDAGIEANVKSQMPTQEDVNKQVFSLLLFNNYSPPENSLSGTGFVGTTGSELLTSQINNWLSKMENDIINVGVSELKQDNVEVELSKQMLDNRLVFESNVGVDNSPDNPNNTSGGGQFVGDFKLEYMVRKDGKVRAKVFNRSETYRIEDQGNSASQTQGIGIFFQEDFESYNQLLNKIFNNKERQEKRKAKKEKRKEKKKSS
tara:strand:+ start:4735 stop:9144 length:4410 start_codon:yes stop_codon:yes gene_type:complete